MRIKHLHVTRYGPMVPFEHDDLGAFTLIHGSNEQGKTLLIDALLRLLFKKELKKTYRRNFGNMNRVSENPEGYVVFENRGEEYKLESKESLPDFFPVSTAPEDFRNVFMVRDSDLTLNAENAYYSRVTEKLTGLRSSEIEKLLKVLQNKGRLRSTSADSDLSNNVEHRKIASRVVEAAALVEEIAALKASLQSDGYDRLETELVGVRERLAGLGEELEVYRAAEENKRFIKAQRTLSELKRVLKTLRRLGHLDPDEHKRWQQLELKRERIDADLRADKKEQIRTDGEIKSARGSLASHEIKVRRAEDRLRRIDTEFRPKIDSYQYERAEYQRAEPQTSLLKRGLLTAGIIFVLATAGYLATRSLVLASFGGAAFVGGVLLGVMLWKLRKAEGVVQAKADNLFTESKRHGLKVESVHELISAVGDLEDEARALAQELVVEKAAVESLEMEKARIESRIESHVERIREMDVAIATLRAKTHMDSAAEYQSELERRMKSEAAAGAKEDILRNILPTDAAVKAAVAEWESRIDGHLRMAEEQEPVEYDRETITELKDEKNTLQEKGKQLENTLKEGSRQLHGMEIRARELGVLEKPPPCRTTHELEHLGKKIAEFIDRIENEKRTAQEAIRIFQAIDAEEKTRVGDLFGPESSVSRHIRSITDGRYSAVLYDLDKNQIYLVDAEGDRVPARFLSGGAYDQLYLSIRLSIAEKMLGEEKGFFLLDDPFVKADIDRLARMLDILKRLVENGWQILYFSAKAEVKDLLQTEISRGRVTLLNLDTPARSGSILD